MQNKPLHVAIVGCGFTGTTAFYQLVRHYPVTRITLFEASGEFGPGFPYQADESPEYLLNNTNDTMCLEPSNRRAFVEWLQRHPQHSNDLDEKASKPRAVYGEFLRDVIERGKAKAERRGIDVQFVPQEVVDVIRESDQGFVVKTASHSVSADRVILATGRCPDYDVYGLTNAAAGHYFPLHMPGTQLDVLPVDAEVHVIGTSLSAYDVVNQLFAASTGCEFLPNGDNRLRYRPNGNRRKVVLCSRNGRLKKVQSRYPCPVQVGHFTLDSVRRLDSDVTLAQLLALMEEDAREHGVTIDRDELADPYTGCNSAEEINKRAASILQHDIDAAASDRESTANFIVDYLDAAQFHIWDVFAAHVLSVSEEAAFRARYESPMLTYAAPCPSITAQKVLALMQSGHLRVLGGIRSISASSDGKTFEIEHRFGREAARYLVNATGAVDRDVESQRQPALISNLVGKGMLGGYRRLPTSQNGAAVDLESFQSETTKGLYVASMLLWGPGYFVSSAIMMATIVERLLKSAFKDR
ncbi:MAG: FAD/NAD(P)-binding protein [Woeseiaceae bacterium]|nr:FAD/NAD(P)-binding protein [Woeseiaceae bacterium]